MSKGTVGGGGTTMLRRINVAAVLDAVRRSAPAPLRVAELVEQTGLARPTVAQAVDELLDTGWLQQHGPDAADRSLGRPAICPGQTVRARLGRPGAGRGDHRGDRRRAQGGRGAGR